MDNYKIKRNSTKLSDEEINRHKDFGKLIQHHKKLHRYREATKPLYKNKGFMSLMILLGVVILVLVFRPSPLDKEAEPQNKTAPAIEGDSVRKENPEAVPE
jgi:hypothetical protein